MDAHITLISDSSSWESAKSYDWYFKPWSNCLYMDAHITLISHVITVLHIGWSYIRQKLFVTRLSHIEHWLRVSYVQRLCVLDVFVQIAGFILNIEKCDGLGLGRNTFLQTNCKCFGMKWLAQFRCWCIYVGHEKQPNDRGKCRKVRLKRRYI